VTYRLPAKFTLVGLVLVAGATFALAACGNDTTPTATSSTASDYVSCLRANGIQLPEGVGASGFPTGRPSGFPSGRPSGAPGNGGASGGPGGGPGGGQRGGIFGNNPPEGVDQEAWQKAMQACAALRPSFGPGGGQGGPGGAANAAYRNCLAENGITVSGPIDQLDESDPTVARALSVCAPLRPSARPQPSQ
jgi:hypothetical protein